MSAMSAAKTRVAVYGGAFDPPTIDHMRLIGQILRSQQIDEVWVVPCGPRKDKPGMATSTWDRWIMCHIAINSFFPPELRVKVSDVDVRQETAMFTHDMLKCLARLHGSTHAFTFVIGTDWLRPETNIRNWMSEDGVTGHILIQEFDFLVLKRPSFDAGLDLSRYGPRFHYLDVDPGFDMIQGAGSSTEVRSRLKATKDLYSVAGLVPTSVLGHIKRERLYELE